jgi:hypothetical protein
MSQAQKAQARAAKAEQQLLQAVRSGEESQRVAAAAGLPLEVQAWLQSVRDAESDRVFQSDPRFHAYGISASDLAGETPEQIKASADRYKRMIDRVEGRVRAEMRRDFGISPDIGGERRGPKVNVSEMPTEDFLKYLDARKASF